MKTLVNEVLEFFFFIVLMVILGVGTVLYAVFVGLYYIYAKITGQEHLIS